MDISSGRLKNLANLVLARYPVPSGVSSIAVVVSPKVDAQQSKWVSFFCCKVLYCKYRMTVYSSVMELLTGVPVAHATPAGDLVQIAALAEHIAGFLRFAGG